MKFHYFESLPAKWINKNKWKIKINVCGMYDLCINGIQIKLVVFMGCNESAKKCT